MNVDSNNKSNDILVMDEKIHIEKYWKIIKPRLHIVIIITLFVVTAAYVKVSTKTPIYQAAGLLMIEPEKNIVMFGNRPSFYGYRNEYLNTQIKILQSRSLARKVMAEFNSTFARDLSGKKGANFSMQGPIVNPLEFTRLVRVSYRSTNPKAAAGLVNILFDKFINFNLDLKSKSSKDAAKYIEMQKKNLGHSLQKKETEMQEYGKRKDLFYVSRQDSTVVEKFSDLSKAYTNAQINRINKEAIYEELKGMTFENYPQVKKDQLVSSLKNTYSSLESEYKKKSQIFKASYPEMTQLKSQLEALQQQIREETIDVAQKTLKEVRSEFQSAKKKEESLLNLLDRQKGTMIDSNSDAIYYKSLNIEVNNMRTLMNYLGRKQEESVLSSRLEGIKTSNIKVIDEAEVPGGPIDSGKKKTLVMALMLGLFLGFGLIFLVDYLDRTIKTPEEVRTMLGIPGLGIIPSTKAKAVSAYYYSHYNYSYGKNKDKSKNKNKKENKDSPVIPDIELINFVDSESIFAENYRTIRTSLLLSIPKVPPKIITISSALPEEGKTTTAVNLAVCFSQLQKKVLVIDGDMRKPRVHKILNLKKTPGLSSFLAGRVKFPEILQKTHIPNLFVVSAGPLPPNPAELIDSEVMSAMLKKLMEKVDFIFIDTPPLVGLVDPILFGKHADGMLLVTWAGKTHRNVVEKTQEELDRFNIRTLGVVLNRAAEKRKGYGYDYSYYSYKYQYKDKDKEELEKLN